MEINPNELGNKHIYLSKSIFYNLTATSNYTQLA